MPRFEQIEIEREDQRSGTFRGFDVRRNGRFEAQWHLFLIREAWDRGCNFEDLADGFGPGLGTMGGDWSGIRDSSDKAADKMLERALNYLFGDQK